METHEPAALHPSAHDPAFCEPGPHFVMFWLLAALATGAAVPCLLVPPTEALLRLAEAEAQIQRKVASLEETAQRQRTMKEALRSDPQLTCRLAMRDLRYRHGGQVEFVCDRPLRLAVSEAAPPAAPVAPEIPAWIEGLYPKRWAVVYRPVLTRHAVLLLSTAVLIFAVCAYGARVSKPPRL